ncbi:hypothetical protein AB2E16_15240 [Escherichia coli]
MVLQCQVSSVCAGQVVPCLMCIVMVCGAAALLVIAVAMSVCVYLRMGVYRMPVRALVVRACCPVCWMPGVRRGCKDDAIRCCGAVVVCAQLRMLSDVRAWLSAVTANAVR